MPEEDEGDEHGRRLVEGLATQEGDQDAEEVGREHARGDEHAHVERAAPQRMVRAGDEDPTTNRTRLAW